MLVKHSEHSGCPLQAVDSTDEFNFKELNAEKWELRELTLTNIFAWHFPHPKATNRDNRGRVMHQEQGLGTWEQPC